MATFTKLALQPAGTTGTGLGIKVVATATAGTAIHTASATATAAQSSAIGTTQILPPTVAKTNSQDAVAGLRTMLPSIVDNKNLYIEHIDNLLDFCDLSILDIINNKLPVNDDKTYSSEALRNLKYIVEFSKIKDALIGSQAYLDL